MLIVLGGLPATGKTTIASQLAEATAAVHLRVDTIEQAIVRSGHSDHPVGAAGYVVGYALAGDLLRQGFSVIAESVNPIALTRDAWRDVASEHHADVYEVELICSDPAEHEHRATTRTIDIPGLIPPTWTEIQAREYHPWHRDHITIDTAGHTPTSCVTNILAEIQR